MFRRVITGIRREYSILKRNKLLLPQLFFALFVVGTFYFTYLPLRKLAWHFHRPLSYYWAEEYRSNSSQVNVKLNNGAQLSLETLLQNNGISSNISTVSIRKNDFVSQCDGCISEPLRLEDVLLDAMPNWSDETFVVQLTEIVHALILAFAVLNLLCLPLLQSIARVSVVSMVTRCLRIIFVLHPIRALVYLSTRIPGPANHCQPKIVADGGGKDRLPRFGNSDIASIFALEFEESCGDLIFSGHTINIVAILVCLYYYVNVMYGERKIAARCVLMIVTLLVLANLFLILCAKNHYTVDILCSILITAPCAICDILLISDFPLGEASDKVMGAPEQGTAREDEWRGDSVSPGSPAGSPQVIHEIT